MPIIFSLFFPFQVCPVIHPSSIPTATGTTKQSFFPSSERLLGLKMHFSDPPLLFIFCLWLRGKQKNKFLHMVDWWISYTIHPRDEEEDAACHPGFKQGGNKKSHIKKMSWFKELLKKKKKQIHLSTFLLEQISRDFSWDALYLLDAESGKKKFDLFPSFSFFFLREKVTSSVGPAWITKRGKGGITRIITFFLKKEGKKGRKTKKQSVIATSSNGRDGTSVTTCCCCSRWWHPGNIRGLWSCFFRCLNVVWPIPSLPPPSPFRSSYYYMLSITSPSKISDNLIFYIFFLGGGTCGCW